MYVSRCLVVATCLCLVSACCSTPPTYFEEFEKEGFTPVIGLAAFSEAIPPKGGKTLFDLGPEGQAALVAASNLKGQKLAAEFATPIRLRSSTAIKKDRSRISLSRRLHFTLYTEHFDPWERLTEAKITVVPPHGWKFTTWSGATVERTSINLANVVDTTARSVGASEVPFLWGWLPGGGASASVQNTQQTTRDLAVEIVKFLPSIQSQQFDLRLFAPFPQTNVAGAYTVDVKLATTQSAFTYVNRIEMVGTDPRLDVTHVYFPAEFTKPPKALANNVTATVVHRTVTDEDARLTISEDDDTVHFRAKTVSNGANVDFGLSDEPLAAFLVEYADNNRQNGVPVMVNVERFNSVYRDQSSQCALFNTAREAELLATYLRSSGFLRRPPRGSMPETIYESADKKYRFTASIDKGSTVHTTPNFNVRVVQIEAVTARPSGVRSQRYKPVGLDQCYVDVDS